MLVHPMEKIEISIDYSIYLLPKIHLFADSLKKKSWSYYCDYGLKNV